MFILLELQTNNGITSALPISVYDNKNDADSAYHSKLAYAATSEVNVHSVVMIEEHGVVLRSEYYEHNNESAGP